MKTVIVKIDNSIPFCELAVGEAFNDGEDIPMMRVADSQCHGYPVKVPKCTAVDLATGKLWEYGEDQRVYRLDATITVKGEIFP